MQFHGKFFLMRQKIYSKVFCMKKMSVVPKCGFYEMEFEVLGWTVSPLAAWIVVSHSCHRVL
jgi:hypothetical protein